MRKPVSILLCSLLLTILGVFAWVAHETVTAAVMPPETTVIRLVNQQEEGPTTVKVGIYVLNIGKLDTSTGAFTIDFYLSFSSDEPGDPGNFEFTNGRATSIDKSVDEPTEKFYRIQASLASNLNMSRYPFDRHNLTVELEDKEQTIRTQVYEVSQQESGLDPAVNIAGWELEGWNAEVVEHYYAPYDTTFSKYVFSIQIQRSALAAIFKTIFPALIIVLMGLLSLVLTPDKIIPRLTLTAGSLTGSVLFHLNMTSSLPPLGYLTFGDRFMLINYLALALALVSTLIALAYVDKKQTEKANRVHDVALGVVPLAWILLHGVNLLLL